MASRTAGQAMRLLTSRPAARSFTTSARRLQEVSPLPARKPMGAFRSGSVKPKEDPLVQRLFGFFFGSTLTGAGIYYYVLDEYKLSNELLTEDIYTLQSAVQRVHEYVQTLEEKVDELEKRRK